MWFGDDHIGSVFVLDDSDDSRTAVADSRWAPLDLHCVTDGDFGLNRPLVWYFEDVHRSPPIFRIGFAVSVEFGVVDGRNGPVGVDEDDVDGEGHIPHDVGTLFLLFVAEEHPVAGIKRLGF